MSDPIKTAAKRIQEAYEQQYIKPDQKKVKVAHKVGEDGRIHITMSGPKTAIDSIHKQIESSVFNLNSSLDGIHIHASHADVKEGVTAEKAEDQTSTLTINHTISNY